MLRKLLIATAMLAQFPGAIAQLADPPGAGGQIQLIPPSTAPLRPIPEIRIDKGAVPAATVPDQTRVAVRSLRITGQTLYPEAELVSITGFSPSELTLSDLRAMAAKISEHYHRNGFFVAQAYLPPQDLSNGVVTIAVLEGRYGSINLRNSTNLSNTLVNDLLEGLNSGDTIAIGPLESRLLLLSDLPGAVVKSTLVPGAAVGTSDLVIDVTPGQRVTGSVEADNAGNRYTGANRIGGTVNLNNPTGNGDVASLRVLTSGDGLKYGRASYQTRIGKATAGIAYAALDYRLGKEFEALQAHGTARILTLYGGYPLIRSRATNLNVLVSYDHKRFEDRTDVPPSLTEKKVRVLSATLYGNHRDRIGAGGLTSYSITGSAGELDILTPAALAQDAAGPRANGSFGKLGFQASRLQNVTDRFSLYGSINGQFASKNLDISEKMSLGGPYGVRAYPVGEAYADEGYVVNLEARYRLPTPTAMPGQLHLIGFVDTGTVTINEEPFGAGPNRRTLSATGIGLNWADYNNFSVSATWAHKLGNARATSAPDSDTRFWVHAIKYF